MKKQVAVLGSTGSIGTQALEIVGHLGYGVAALSAKSDIDALETQIVKYGPQLVAVADEAAAAQLGARLSGMANAPKVLAGPAATEQVAQACAADIVLNAVVGIAGLGATLAALSRGIDVALANKESLVTGGGLVLAECEKHGARLLPVDSEHSAIFQCLQDAHAAKSLEKIILTASGGPFYGKTEAELAAVTKEQALRHPNWDMGQKITIDSATMMNKGLELIEAMWLFGLPADKIEVVVQRQSVIHSMVQFSDRSILAQMGVPDMRVPIQYALTWPDRLPGVAPELDFRKLAQLDFGAADEGTFRCLAACRRAAEKGGLAPCAANGAGEQAVDLFLRERISFLDIGRLVEACVDADSYAGGYALEDVYDCDAAARRFVRERAGV